MTRRFITMVLSVGLAGVGCDDAPPTPPEEPPSTPVKPPKPSKPAPLASTTASARPATTARPAPKRDLDQRCPEAPSDLPPLRVTKFAVTSKLEDKRPTDDVAMARPGDKLYAYLVVENMGPAPNGEKRCVAVTFNVNGRRRATLTLDVGRSPKWRTWAHITPTERDAPGAVDIVVVDDQGREHVKHKVLLEPDKK